MSEIRFKDRTGWSPGPWDAEPDKVVWIDEATDLDCMIVRGPVGALCGYVGVPPSHRLHGIGYSQPDRPCDENCDPDFCYSHDVGSIVDVHGGLTYSEFCQEGREAEGICHVPQDGRPANVWWFGFDCAHSGDLCPASTRHMVGRVFAEGLGVGMGEYRTLPYVRSEVESLARQLAEVAS